MSKHFGLSVNHTSPLPPPSDYLLRMPAQKHQRDFITSARSTIANIINGIDGRLLLVIGPCSLHDPQQALDYAAKLKKLAKSVSNQIFLVMRCYFEKARTRSGWKGLLYDPFLDKSHGSEKGIQIARQLLIELSNQEIAAGTEFLDPATPHYLADLISWGCIGARTTASQTHRQMASSLIMPIAFKNTVDGNFNIATDAVVSSREPQTFIGLTPEGLLAQVQSSGNPHTHVVLRGGGNRSNFDEHSIEKATESLTHAGIGSKLLVDCAHGNSGKDHRRQSAVFQSVLQQFLSGNQNIGGMILESHLNAGHQSIRSLKNLKYGVSITDPCISWECTERLVLRAAEQIQNFWKTPAEKIASE